MIWKREPCWVLHRIILSQRSFLFSRIATASVCHEGYQGMIDWRVYVCFNSYNCEGHLGFYHEKDLSQSDSAPLWQMWPCLCPSAQQILGKSHPQHPSQRGAMDPLPACGLSQLIHESGDTQSPLPHLLCVRRWQKAFLEVGVMTAFITIILMSESSYETL